jgi:hypothetical protein
MTKSSQFLGMLFLDEGKYEYMLRRHPTRVASVNQPQVIFLSCLLK